jgi:hypothetical protein
VSLLDFQKALGRKVRTPVGKNALNGLHLTRDERARVDAITKSAGFRFTIDVQQSWSVDRASKAARLTLSVLPVRKRRRLLDEWVGSGGGTASFYNAEADAFLDFIAKHLPEPSHELALCNLEKATLLASEGSRHFIEPDPSRLDAPNSVLRLGAYSSIVLLHAKPELLLAALDGAPFPPLSQNIISLLFAPGLRGLFREATDGEVTLLKKLVKPVKFRTLLGEGYPREIIEALLVAGGAEYAEPKKQNKLGKSTTNVKRHSQS